MSLELWPQLVSPAARGPGFIPRWMEQKGACSALIRDLARELDP